MREDYNLDWDKSNRGNGVYPTVLSEALDVL